MMLLPTGQRGRLQSSSLLPRKEMERRSSANGRSRLQIAKWYFSRRYGMLILWARPRRLPFTSQPISWRKLGDSQARVPPRLCGKDLSPWRLPMPIANSGRYAARWMCRSILKPFGRIEGGRRRHQFADRILMRQMPVLVTSTRPAVETPSSPSSCGIIRRTSKRSKGA